MEYRGLSQNQLCIGIACDSVHSFFIFEGYGKTSGTKTLKAFANHIKPGSKLIHDLDDSHNKIVDLLNLESETHNSKVIKALDDSENPLEPVNQMCRLLQVFLHSHSGFVREDIQGYMNIFSVIMNPPETKV